MTAIETIHHMLRAVLPFKWADYPFMLNALLTVMLLAPCCAALGVKVVNFRMAFFSDAISHSAFTGVIVGFVLVRTLFEPEKWAYWDRIVPPVALVVLGLAVAAGVTALKRRTDLSSDTVIGVFFATTIAGGIALMSRFALTRDFQQYLYGSILTATDVDVVITAALALVVLVFFAFSFNRLLLIGLNSALADSRAIRTRAYEYVFSLLLGLVVTLSIRTVGLLLVTALLVVPAAAARNVAHNAGSMVRLAALIGLISGMCGLVASYYLRTSAGATIILTAAVVFVFSLTVRGGRASPPRVEMGSS